MNNNSYQHIPIEDAYEIFKEKCLNEDIEPPTFEKYKARNSSISADFRKCNY